MKSSSIFCIAKEKNIALSLKKEIQDIYQEKHSIEVFTNPEEAFSFLQKLVEEKDDIPLVIADYLMPVMKGDKLLSQIHKISPNTVKIMITEQNNIETVYKDVSHIVDFLYKIIGKPWIKKDLTLTITEAVKTFYQDKEIKDQKQEIEDQYDTIEKLKDELKTANRGLKQYGVEKVSELTYEIKTLKNIKKDLEYEKKEMLDASKKKSEYLANLSHKILTPMNGILPTIKLALNQDISSNVKHYLEIMQSSSNLLLKLFNDLMDFFKLEAEKFELENRDFLLNDILKETIDSFKQKANEKKIKLAIFFTNEIISNVIGDPLRIQQILTNILNNALEFTKRFGTIAISVNALETTPENILLKFIVKDTGTGIKTENLNKLFIPFAQFDPALKEKAESTGLGLNICKYLVELMDGNMWIRSTIEKGTKVHFTIKLKVQKVKNKDDLQLCGKEDLNSEENIKKRLNGSHILIVDDDVINQEIICEILKEAQISVSIANNGKAALLMLSKNKQITYDAILMDVQMPEMDGYRATKLIRSFQSLCEVPIIAMTANTLKEDKDKCFEVGMDAYVAKPVNSDSLFYTLSNFIKPKKNMPVTEVKKSQNEDNQTEDLNIPEKLPGLNFQKLLKSIKFNRKIFDRISIAFLEKNENTEADFKLFFETKDWNKLHLQIHSLKGSSGIIGANELYEAAKQLETACKNPEPDEPDQSLLDNAISELNQVLKSLQLLNPKK